MSSSQLNYPVKLQLQTQEKKQTLSLKKGPQREKIDLDQFAVRLVRSGNSLQPHITADEDDTLHSLILTIPLGETWAPLFRKEDRSAHSSLLLLSENNSVMQINLSPREKGTVKFTLDEKGGALEILWDAPFPLKAKEELDLPEIQMTLRDKRVEPVRFGLRNPAGTNLNRGRLFSFTGRPDLEEIRRDVNVLSAGKNRFDFFLLDYGTASEWGDWDQPLPAFTEGINSLPGLVRPLGALAGVRLSPLTCSKKSEFYKNGKELLLGKGKTFKILSQPGNPILQPLDITKKAVQEHIDKSLNYYVSRGIKFIHLDHLDLLFSEAEWETAMEPQKRLKLLTDLMEPFKSRGVKFSTTPLPICEELDRFDVIFSGLDDPQTGFSDLMNLAVSLKNSPPLSLGKLILSDKGKNREKKRRKIHLHSQSLLNGPFLLGDKTDDLDEGLLESWKIWATDRKDPLLPLEVSEYGLGQGVLLLMNRQKMTAILNLGRKTRVISLKEGELAGSRGYSPSETTSLKSRELILQMNRESSHYFRV
ncbi:MAG: hypothetical protein PQJ59_04435 [Spirochaetales bacterium]|nr:hypothetical protein [Spirochaetales bacterium]